MQFGAALAALCPDDRHRPRLASQNGAGSAFAASPAPIRLQSKLTPVPRMLQLTDPVIHDLNIAIDRQSTDYSRAAIRHQKRQIFGSWLVGLSIAATFAVSLSAAIGIAASGFLMRGADLELAKQYSATFKIFQVAEQALDRIDPENPAEEVAFIFERLGREVLLSRPNGSGSGIRGPSRRRPRSANRRRAVAPSSQANIFTSTEYGRPYMVYTPRPWPDSPQRRFPDRDRNHMLSGPAL